MLDRGVFLLECKDFLAYLILTEVYDFLNRVHMFGLGLFITVIRAVGLVFSAGLLSTLVLMEDFEFGHMLLIDQVCTALVILCLKHLGQDAVANIIDEVNLILGALGLTFHRVDYLSFDDQDSFLEAIKHVLILLELTHTFLFCD